MKLHALVQPHIDTGRLKAAPGFVMDDRAVVRVTVDSRKVGPGTVFVACPGATKTSRAGHEFIATAIERGAVAIVAETIPAGVPLSIPVFLTRQPRTVAALLTEAVLGAPSHNSRVIGVTGTNGKTTTTYLVARIARHSGIRSAVFGTLGIGDPDRPRATGFTTPEAEVASTALAELVATDTDVIAMEVSSHALATARVDGLTFAAAGFTNLSRDHLDFHGTLEAYFVAKARLFSELLPPSAPAVLPASDDEHGFHARLRALRKDAITWGLEEGARLRLRDIRASSAGLEFTLVFDGQELATRSPLVGAFNLENILVAAGLCLGLGMGLAAVAAGLAVAGPPPGRMERVPGAGPLVLVDYAHTPDALERALLAARAVAPARLFVVFGCGGDRDAGKRSLMGRVAADIADVVVLTDDNPRSEPSGAILDAIQAGVVGKRPTGVEGLDKGTWTRVPNRRLAIRAAVRAAQEDDVVLIAGKGHEKEQIQGALKYPFDDVVEASAARTGASRPAYVARTEAVAALATGGGRAQGAAPDMFAGVSTDSRAIERGSLFIALKGENFDGHQFVETALADGAAAALVDENWAAGRVTDRPLFVVDDTLQGLQDLARAHLKVSPALRLCLTGSNGKTTTKELCAAALRACVGFDAVVATEGNLNNHIGVPLTALRVEPHHRVAVIEMGMNHLGEIAAYCEVAPPQVALITNIGTAHAGNVGGIEGVAQAKAEIFAELAPHDVAVVNADDPRCVREAQAKAKCRHVSFGRAEWADIRLLSAIDDEDCGQRIELWHAGETVEVTLPLDGRHNAINAAGAVAAAVACGFDFAVAARGLANVRPAQGRLERKRRRDGLLVLDDSYNANPDSMEAGLDALRTIAGDRRRIACLGAMLELGSMTTEAHRHLGASAAQAGLALLFVCGEPGRATADGAVSAGFPREGVMWAADSVGLGALVAQAVHPADVVLVKGSRGARMERVVEALLGPQSPKMDVH